jgi:alpha-amylase
VSYRLVSRSGDRAAFVDMVRRCKAARVDVYVDAVLNHMSFVESGVGSGGTAFTRTSYPGLYDIRHFHTCGREIRDQGSRAEIHTCELATLPDLDTGNEHVRSTLAAYLQDLVDIGVAGIRIDAAKHISPEDLRAILGRVRGSLYAYQEVIDNDGRGVVTSQEYSALGDVTEFRYGAELSRVLRSGKLAWLETFGPKWGFLDSAAAIAFVDNHDNQRGHGSGDPLTFKDRDLYELALVFMLAYPYGYPQIMSSYAFTGPNEGPPSTADGKTTRALTAAGECAAGWVCEHRWPAVKSMVHFRNTTASAFATSHFWTDGDRQIAFGRGDRGFVALNASAAPLSRRLATGMAAGEYCDVLGRGPAVGACAGGAVTVGADGTVGVAVAPGRAMAIEVGRRP